MHVCMHSFIHSFIHSGYLYSAPSRNLIRGALSPATAKEKCLKQLAERRHIAPGQLAEYKREFIPSWQVMTAFALLLYCIVLYCIVLYCIVLYCIVLYCIVL